MSHESTSLSDEAIIEAIVNDGQSDLYGHLYDRYSDKVFRKCIGFAKDKDIAQDMVQDIFLKVFFQLPKFKFKSKFSTWLYAITYNFCVEYYRKTSRYVHTDIDNQPEAADDSQDEQELLQTQAALLKRALEIISPDDKAILLMKYQDDASIKEIEENLGISESAVKMRLSRARLRAREAIDSLEEKLT